MFMELKQILYSVKQKLICFEYLYLNIGEKEPLVY